MVRDTTRLADKPWAYLKVLQTAYKQLQPSRFDDLFVLEASKLLQRPSTKPSRFARSPSSVVAPQRHLPPQGGKVLAAPSRRQHPWVHNPRRIERALRRRERRPKQVGPLRGRQGIGSRPTGDGVSRDALIFRAPAR